MGYNRDKFHNFIVSELDPTHTLKTETTHTNTHKHTHTHIHTHTHTHIHTMNQKEVRTSQMQKHFGCLSI